MSCSVAVPFTISSQDCYRLLKICYFSEGKPAGGLLCTPARPGQAALVMFCFIEMLFKDLVKEDSHHDVLSQSVGV